jgi:Protein of unknown function (DUF4239)
VNLLVAVLIVVVAAVVAGAAFALVHRISRRSLLSDSGRGRPMIQVTGTLFAVVLAFVILAAFQTYNGARAGAQSEAVAILDMTRTAALFPPAERDRLRADFVCYGRAVVDEEWPAMRRGHSSPLVDHWVNAYLATFGGLALASPRQQLALQELLNLAGTRSAGRLQRLADSTPAVPTPLWLALVFGGCVAVLLQLSMADGRERIRVQSGLVAGFAAVVAACLLIVDFLDHPYRPQLGGIHPTAMRQTLVMASSLDPGLRPACTLAGRPI